MKKAIVALAILVGVAGLNGAAEARNGVGGMGSGMRAGALGNGMHAGTMSQGASAYQGAGDTLRVSDQDQLQDRLRDPALHLDPETGLPLADQLQTRDRLQDPTLHTVTVPVVE